VDRRNFLQLGLAGVAELGLPWSFPLQAGAQDVSSTRPVASKRPATQPIYCCIFIEFIQPWDQDEALRQVKELGLGNMVSVSETFHVGNSDEDRRLWKERFPSLADQVDAVPRFPERPEHGHAVVFDLPPDFRRQQLQLCRELGLLMFTWPRELPANERSHEPDPALFSALITGESLSILTITRSLEQLKAMETQPVTRDLDGDIPEQLKRQKVSIFDNPEQLDFQVMHDWMVRRFRLHGDALRARHGGRLAAIESSTQVRMSLEAGGDVPIFELVPSDPLRGLASTRGAAVAYGKDFWGVHTAMGYYRAPTDRWTPERLRIAYDLFYAGGASYFSEPNLALRNWGSCSAFFQMRGSPDIRWAEQECRPFDDPICVRGREVLSSFYHFTQFHQRPAGGPRVRLGYVLGNLDSWGGNREERLWMVDHPGFLATDALETWHHIKHVFDTEPWYIGPRLYYWQADPAKPLQHSTPPCGQVDLVPSEAPLEKLEGYGTLVFLGWNTMTEELYAKLVAFVEGGGTLFLSVPHLDTRTRSDQPHAFLNNGDVGRLCGVRIVGPGPQAKDVLFARQTTSGRHVMPQGTRYLESAPLAQVELAGARMLAHPRGKTDQPVLLEHRLGKGTVYLLATWEYPGQRLDALITDILRTLAEAEQTEIAVEGRDVFYAVYDGTMPSGQPFSTVYLVNHDIHGQSAYPVLVLHKARMPVRVGNELRIAWIFDELLVTPSNRFTQVTDARREGGGWTVTLESASSAPAEEQRLQIRTPGTASAITLDDKTLILEKGIEGDHFVRCRLSGHQVLRIEGTL